jgi:hypothetical protein
MSEGRKGKGVGWWRGLNGSASSPRARGRAWQPRPPDKFRAEVDAGLCRALGASAHGAGERREGPWLVGTRVRMQGQTFVAPGRRVLRARRATAMLMPVASGSMTHVDAVVSPAMRRACSAMWWVSLDRSEEPAALGCSAVKSPERPTP